MPGSMGNKGFLDAISELLSVLTKRPTKPSREKLLKLISAGDKLADVKDVPSRYWRMLRSGQAHGLADMAAYDEALGGANNILPMTPSRWHPPGNRAVGQARLDNLEIIAQLLQAAET